MKYNKNMTLGEILQDNPENADVLLGFGMHCLGCPMSRKETLEQACEVHELDLNFVLAQLNAKNEQTNENKPTQKKNETKPKTAK